MGNLWVKMLPLCARCLSVTGQPETAYLVDLGILEPQAQLDINHRLQMSFTSSRRSQPISYSWVPHPSGTCRSREATKETGAVPGSPSSHAPATTAFETWKLPADGDLRRRLRYLDQTRSEALCDWTRSPTVCM